MLPAPLEPGRAGAGIAGESPRDWSALAARARKVLEGAGSESPTMAASELPSVACVVLNWNGWHDTLNCLACLKRLEYPELTVLIVDNGSTDGSVARIREAFPDIPVIETGANLGFAAGNNIGIRAALEGGADYVWVLNNDTQPRSEALTGLVRHAEADPSLGAVGSVLPYVDDTARIQAWGGGRINIWTARVVHARAPKEERWFEFLTAASVLLRREALETCGLFDEGFFLYWEDVDLSYRLRKHGWKLGVAPDSIVPHREHASTGRDYRVLDRHAVASGIRFMRKHSPAPWLSIPLLLSVKIGKRVLTGRINRVGDILAGLKDYRLRCQLLAGHGAPSQGASGAASR
jgi:GT2 family glycosyltransferase